MASVGEADPKVVQQTVLSTPGAGASTAQPSSHTNSYASADPVASGDMSIHEAVSIQEPTATTALLSRESSFVAGSQGPTRSVLAASDPTTNPDKRGTDLGRYSMSSMRYTCAAARPSDLRRSLLEDTAEASKATGMELVASLHEATNRVHQELQARAAALEAARRAFEQEVDTKRASLMAQEFEVMRSANQLRREQVRRPLHGSRASCVSKTGAAVLSVCMHDLEQDVNGRARRHLQKGPSTRCVGPQACRCGDMPL